MPCGITMPYSFSSPRIWLPCAVRALTNAWRARCKHSTLCCSAVLIGTKRMLGRATASQIASASATIVLVRLDVRLDELRGHQLYLVAQRLQLPRPMVRAAAGFHASQARRHIGEKRGYLIALELPLQHRLAPLIYAMHLDYVLCQIQPHRRNLHLVAPSRCKWTSTISTLAP